MSKTKNVGYGLSIGVGVGTALGVALRSTGTEWKYLYRAVDSAGDTIEFMLSAKRDVPAAKRFFRKVMRADHRRLPFTIGNDAANGSLLRSILYVAPKDLTFMEEADGWRTATFDVVAVTFDDAGNAVDQISRTDALRLRGEGYQQVLKDGFVYLLVFPVKKPGAYQLRAVLRDHGSERVGSAGQFVEVPDLKKGRLALSGVVVSATDQPAAGREGTEATRPDPQAGEAVRHFKAGMVMRYSFVIYNARLDKAQGAPQLQVQARLFRGDQPVFTGKVQPFTLNNPPDITRLAAEGAVTLGADMAPGEYVLEVTVNDLLADEKHRTATQWMDFEIVK